MHKWRAGMVLVAFTLVPGVSFADSGSKLLATGGASTIEGAGGE